MPEKNEIKNILWFSEINPDNDFIFVGGKNSNLGRMLSFGVRVPPGYAVTTRAFDSFLDLTGIRKEILTLISSISFESIKTTETAGAQIRTLIEATSIPAQIVDEISNAYDRLCKQCGIKGLPVAVRSSATSEDLETASFAGQHETYLWVKSADQVVEHVSKCWASLFTDRAIAYRNRVNWPQHKVTISVCVQKMVNAKCAGVMFTIHPVTGNQDEMVIEGNWGLGESVVSGIADIDMYLIAKEDLSVKDKKLGEKKVQIVPKDAGVEEVEISMEKRNAYVLTDKEATEIASLGKKLEGCLKKPQDLEWAIDADMVYPENIYLLQTRPIVGVKPQKKRTNEEIIIDDLIKKLF